MDRAAPGRAVRRGVLAGAAATVPMSVAMLVAQKAGLLGKMPPQRITEAALDAAEVPRPPGRSRPLAVLAHVAFGAGCGAAYAWLSRRRAGWARSPLAGAAYGSFVWAASDMGWVPALGILPQVDRDKPGRPPSMLAAHWVYGATLAWLLRQARRRD